MIINQPRGDMLGWDEYSNPIEADDAVKLSGGIYVAQNQLFHKQSGQSKDLDYSWQNPIRNLYAPNRAREYTVGMPGRNYGYGALYGNEELQRHIARVSNETGVPGRWLADSLALVTRGTFSPHSEQGGGAFGLVAKTPEQVMQLGISPTQYSRGDIKTQMDAVSQQLQQSGVAGEGAEFTLTSLLNSEAAQRTYEKPRLAMGMNNGVYTLQDMWDALGSHQDIAYDHSLNNLRRASNSHKHDGFNPNCAWCLSLAQSRSDIVPHEFQDAFKF